jgi:aminoglycoside 6'-N-acetyltransferase
MRLRGARVALRPLASTDLERVLAILDEPEVSRWWGEHDAERVRTEQLDPNYRHAGIDIFVATAHQGHGLGSEAIRVLARHLFVERGHHRLVIDPAAANARAIRAYERVGFRPCGVMREYERGADGIWHDGLLMDLLAREFLAAN